MHSRPRLSNALVIVGFGAMLLGALDPLEGSLLILPGSGIVSLGAVLGRSRFRKLLGVAFALVLLGVAIMFGISALGGVGGSTGRSLWWALLVLPYPAGWVLGVVGVVRRFREPSWRGREES
jgi:hypothetical protein